MAGQLPGMGEAGWGRSLTLGAGLAMGPAVAVGFARFAYALLLPPMRADLGWTYAQAGGINTANTGGYLGGAILAAPVAARIGVRRAFAAGLVTTALALLLSGGTSSYGLLLLLRVVAGVGGALAFVSGGALAAQLASRTAGRVATVLAIYMAGGGFGVLMSGLVLRPSLSWREGWVVLGLLSLVSLVCALLASVRIDDPVRPAGLIVLGPPRALWRAWVAYGLFGLGYIAYMTFVVAYLRANGQGGGAITVFWSVLGAAAIASAGVWGPVLDRMRGGRGSATVLVVVAVGAALPLLSAAPPVAVGSAVLFGASFLTVVTAMTALVQRTMPPADWTAAIAAMTIAFALGQCLGPVLSGLVSDGPGGLRSGPGISAALLLAASVVAMIQREVPVRASFAHPDSEER